MANPLKIYIAGKITGNPNYREDFTIGTVAVLKKIRGTYGRNLPVTLMLPSTEPKGLTNRHYMRISLDRIDECDIVAFLPNYTDSQGAQIEERYARYTDKQLMYLTVEEFENVRSAQERKKAEQPYIIIGEEDEEHD